MQQLLKETFGIEIERSNCMFNWYARDLKKFSDDELYNLNATCIFFKTDNPKLSQTIQNRIGKEIARRILNKKPKIKILKNG